MDAVLHLVLVCRLAMKVISVAMIGTGETKVFESGFEPHNEDNHHMGTNPIL